MKHAWVVILVSGIIFLAPFLGGATSGWVCGLLLACIGGVVIALPPDRMPRSISPSWGVFSHWGVVILLVALFPLLGFLPLGMVLSPSWKNELIGDYGFEFSPVLAAQPWVTFESILLLWGALIWLAYLLTHEATSQYRFSMIRLQGAAVIVIAGAAWLFYFQGQNPDFWKPEHGFGPFPNRNQFANLIAVGAVACLAAGMESRARKRQQGYFWFLVLIPLLVTLVKVGSRAGILLFFCGLLGYGVLLSMMPSNRRSRDQQDTDDKFKNLSIVLGGVFILFAGVFVFGGAVLERLYDTQLSLTGASDRPTDWRWLIQYDALMFSLQSPFTGVGLGSFPQVFALGRESIESINRAKHPESDLLWLAVEGGWIHVVLIGWLLLLLIVPSWPPSHRSDRRLRAGAFIAAGVFLLHSLVDVSAHRMGTVIPAILLLSLAPYRKETVEASQLAPNLFRGLGMLLVLVGVGLLATSQGAGVIPGSIRAEYHYQQALKLTEAGGRQNAEQAIEHCSDALKDMPLDWRLWFQRGLLRAATGQLENARNDFRRARVLEPNNPWVAFREGEVWAPINPSWAAVAWNDALSRGTKDHPEIFSQALRLTKEQPDLRRRLMVIVRGDVELEIQAVESLFKEQFYFFIYRLLGNSPEELRVKPYLYAQAFRRFSQEVEPRAFQRELEEHPDWAAYAWIWLGRSYIADGDLQTALALADQYLEEPHAPAVGWQSASRATHLERLHYGRNHPQVEVSSLYILSRQAIAKNDWLEVITLFEMLPEEANKPGALPAYLLYLRYQAHLRMKESQKAWTYAVKCREQLIVEQAQKN